MLDALHVCCQPLYMAAWEFPGESRGTCEEGNQQGQESGASD